MTSRTTRGAVAQVSPRVRPRARVRVVDLFAGGGGTSSGLVRALVRLGLSRERVSLIAINHDPIALATHKANHPWATHYEDDVEQLDPRPILGDEEIDVLVGSPPCQEYSRAAGGKPKNRQRRATVFYLLKWIRYGRPRVCIFENVPEFLKTGEYRRLVRGIKALRKVGLHYRVEEKVLDAADYGGAQNRNRAFIQLARDDAPIVWPRQTHSDPMKPVAGTRPWRGAIEILDLDEPTRSVFERPKPLVVNTRKRLARGIREEWGAFWEPLAQAVEADSGPVSLRAMLEASPREEWPDQLRVKGRVHSFTVGAGGPAWQGEPKSTRKPLRSLTTDPHLAVCDLVLVLGQQGGAVPRSVREPVPTIPTAGYLRVAGVDLILPARGRNGGLRANKARGTSQPLNAVVAGKVSASVADARVELRPILVPRHREREGQAPRYHKTSRPLPVVACSAEPGLVEPLVVTYNGNAGVRGVSRPLTTETTVQRHFLADHEVMVNAEDVWVHATLRQCTVRELARGQGFPDEYVLKGNKRQQVAQIGNAVHVDVSDHLITSAFTGLGYRVARLTDYDDPTPADGAGDASEVAA